MGNSVVDCFTFAPPKIVDWRPDSKRVETATYHGQPATSACGWPLWRPVQIEFIQPLEGQNLYASFLQNGEGLHHFLFLVDDPQEVTQTLGVAVLQSTT